MKTQNASILAYLQKGNKLTSLTALRLFGCLRLSGRILELREQGYKIDSPMIAVGKKRIAEYVLRA